MQAGRGESFRTHEPVFVVADDGRWVDEGLERGLEFFWGQNSFWFDMNQDGIPDIVDSGQTYYTLDPSGQFSDINRLTCVNADWLMIADLDGDTLVDYNCQHEGTFPANVCLLYTSPSPRDATLSRMPSSA